MHFERLGLQHEQGAELSLAAAATLQEGIDEEYQIMYVGSLSVEIDPMDQDVRHSLHVCAFASIKRIASH